MGSNQSQQRLDLCKDQLANVRQMFNSNMEIIKQQLQAANEGVKQQRNQLLEMQKDGGLTVQKTQQTILKIQEYQGNIQAKQKQYELDDRKVRELERQCDELERSVMEKKRSLDECMDSQGILPYNQEFIAASVVFLTTSLISGVITKQVVKK